MLRLCAQQCLHRVRQAAPLLATALEDWRVVQVLERATKAKPAGGKPGRIRARPLSAAGRSHELFLAGFAARSRKPCSCSSGVAPSTPPKRNGKPAAATIAQPRASTPKATAADHGGRDGDNGAANLLKVINTETTDEQDMKASTFFAAYGKGGFTVGRSAHNRHDVLLKLKDYPPDRHFNEVLVRHGQARPFPELPEQTGLNHGVQLSPGPCLCKHNNVLQSQHTSSSWLPLSQACGLVMPSMCSVCTNAAIRHWAVCRTS